MSAFSFIQKPLHLSARKWLLLYVETQSRELDAKALLSFVAAERGWATIVGKGLRGRPYLPQGVFLENSIAPGRKTDVVAHRALGTRVAAVCEEGLIYRNTEIYGRRRVEKESYDLIDLYFAWGRGQADDMIGDLNCDPAKMRVTGNPRFDLLRPDFSGYLSARAEQIKKRYGSILLINTKFGKYSSYVGSEALLDQMRYRKKIRTPEHEAEMQQMIEFQKQGWFKFQEAIKALSERFPQQSIVVRPHPSERLDAWQQFADGLPNVFAVFEGNVADWLMASELCIHQNCMTGAEGYALGKPVIAYRPIRDPRFDAKLPNDLSFEAYDSESLCQNVQTVLDGKPLGDEAERKQKEELARRHIQNLDGKPACESIMDELERLDVQPQPFNHSVGLSRQMYLQFARPQLSRLRHMVRNEQQKARVRYGKQKFPGVSLEDFQDLLQRFQSATGRFSDIQLTQLETNVFCVYRPDGVDRPESS
jgi:surface carbohydrate biosynthesis protein